MTNTKAIKIANDFLGKVNPEMWNGFGDKPDSLIQMVYSCPAVDGMRLDLSIEYDENDGWCHFCEVVDDDANLMVDCATGYGIDSPQNIADTIMYLCGVMKL